MKNYAHILPFILLIISLVLMYIDNYFSGLTLYLMGIIYILIGSNELRQNSRKFNFYLIIGLFITTVTFLGEFVSGYIMLDTISMYEEVTKIKQSSN
jgi:membrane-bound ClpP family serine protease